MDGGYALAYSACQLCQLFSWFSLTLPHGDEQLCNTHTGVIPLVHYHWLEFWTQSIEESIFSLVFQVAGSEHIAVELLEFDPDLHHLLIVVSLQLTMGLLDAVKLVQQVCLCWYLCLSQDVLAVTRLKCRLEH